LTQRPYATLYLTAHYKIGKSTRIGLDFENVFNKRYRCFSTLENRSL